MWVQVDSRHHFLSTVAKEGMRISVPWPDEALPHPGSTMGVREGVLALGSDPPRVRLDRGGSVELPSRGFHYESEG